MNRKDNKDDDKKRLIKDILDLCRDLCISGPSKKDLTKKTINELEYIHYLLMGKYN